MPISDYAHHNEEASRIWWEEEGRHEGMHEPTDDDYVNWREAAEYDDEGSDLDEGDESC